MAKRQLKRRPLKTIPTLPEPTPPEPTAAQMATGAPKADLSARTGAQNVALTLGANRSPQL